MLRKFFAPNIQRIEGIRAIGAVLEKVFFWFGILLGGFVFFCRSHYDRVPRQRIEWRG